MSKFITQFRNGDVFPWERDFTREVFGIALPVVIQSIFMALMHIVDNIMIGQLGEIELAAVTQANRVTFLFQLVIFGLSSGTSTFVAQFWGKRDLRGIHQTMGLALCLSVVSALAFFLPCVLIPRQIMSIFLRDPLAIEAAVQYLQVIAYGYLGTALVQCFATVLKSTEQARLPMFADIAGIATNTFLNYCLIFGHFGMPRLGVRGGAIATVISIFVTFAIVCAGGYIMKLATAVRLSDIIPRSKAFARKYLAIALPVILNEGLWSLGMVLYSVVYGQMGTAAVSTISIFNTVEQIAVATMRGLTSACAVIVGKRIGAGDNEGAYRAAKRMLFSAAPSGLLSAAVLLLISTPLVHIFNVSDAVRQDALTLVRIAACVEWLHQLGGLLIVGIMRSGGDVRMSLVLDVLPVWLVGVPMVALGGLVLKLPLPYVYIMVQAESAVKIILGLRRYRSRKWIHNLVK